MREVENAAATVSSNCFGLSCAGLNCSYIQVVKTLRDMLLVQDNIHTTVEEQVAMFFHVVGHNQRFSFDIQEIHIDNIQLLETSER